MKSSAKLDQQHWHVLGAGAIGCLWAAHLTLAGSSVRLIMKNRQRLDQFNKAPGLVLVRDSSEQMITLSAETAECTPSAIENLLVCTKSTDTLPAIRSVDHRLTESSRIYLLMNGLGAQQQVSAAFPNHPVICATTTDGAYQRAPFEIVHAGVGETHFGFLKQQLCTPNIRTVFSNHFNRLGLITHWDKDIFPRLLQKLAVNAVINPLTVVYQCTNGGIIEGIERLSLVRRLCEEIASVLEAILPGHQLDLYAGVLSIARATASNYSSMYQDIANGRITEIDYINGYLCQQAKRLSLPTPLNDRLVSQIKALHP